MIKSEKGSITVYVLITMMFFVTVLSLAYANKASQISNQKKQVAKIEKEYTVSDEEMEAIYYKKQSEVVTPIEPTGIYVALVGDTLKFYTTEKGANASGGKVYGNVQGKTFTRDNTDNIETPSTPWFQDKAQIKKAEFVDEVAPEYMAYFFSDLDELETVDMAKVKTINVTDMYGMILNCRKLKEVDTKAFDTANVTNMGWMFLNCSSLTNLDLSSFDTRNVTNMEVMFNGCSGLTQLDVTGFDTRNVTTMRSMFANCSNLAQIDVSNFDTANVTNMNNMFLNCTNLTQIYVGNKWKVATLNDGMFWNCGTDKTTPKT